MLPDGDPAPTSGHAVSDEAVWAQVEAGLAPTAARVAAVAASKRLHLGQAGVARHAAELSAAVLGAGPLEPWLHHPDVTDVLVNGIDGVWVDRGGGVERVACEVGGAPEVRQLAVRLAGLAGRRLDDSTPYVDGLLPGGVRLHAVLPPLVAGAAHLSLRVPRRTSPRLDDLVRWGCFPADWAPVLRDLVSARVSFVVSGGTGTGKTTLMAALLAEVEPAARIVLVEDVRELSVDHPHVVRLQARPANVEGRGEVDLVTMTRQALRMRPDRLVVGEVRGAEVREMLAALNTGHDGGCSTVHANTSADVIPRFEALGVLAGLPPPAVRTQLASAVQVVAHLRRSGGRRHLAEIGVLASSPGDGLEVQPALAFAPTTGAAQGPGWTRLASLLGRPGAAPPGGPS
ncbi:MAG: TadA family conjugal transfer-associated ATPase [Austwickia sp.]|nr:TadA family conjugal transfer-associated ATPase [Austwickia sp.]